MLSWRLFSALPTRKAYSSAVFSFVTKLLRPGRERKVAHILHEHGSVVYTTPTSDSVFEAAQRMAELNIGSLLICEPEAGGDVVGIFTERDYLKFVNRGKNLGRDTLVEEVMTPADEMRFVFPSETESYCRNLMLKLGVRHLPVCDKRSNNVIGILSVRDLLADSVLQRSISVSYMGKTKIAPSIARDARKFTNGVKYFEDLEESQK